MNRLEQVQYNHNLRRKRVRSTVTGTTDRPRLTVHISNRHVSAQLVDDSRGITLTSVTTVQQKQASGSLTQLCQWAGSEIAKKAVTLKIKAVVLDRNGRQYQQRLRAFAEAARTNGLEF